MDMGAPGGQLHSKIDHIIDRKFSPTDVTVVNKFYRIRPSSRRRWILLFCAWRESCEVQETRFETVVNFDRFTSMGRLWEDSVSDNINEGYDRLFEPLHDLLSELRQLQNQPDGPLGLILSLRNG
ncbi:hypothetical protein V3C99_018486 [Haemonchus contortus]|uniref:Sucrose synthase n=1 Tax=Haemonchus contortus TaxID=6289 RepID=A0A7I5EDW3_HAECO